MRVSTPKQNSRFKYYIFVHPENCDDFPYLITSITIINIIKMQ